MAASVKLPGCTNPVAQGQGAEPQAELEAPLPEPRQADGQQDERPRLAPGDAVEVGAAGKVLQPQQPLAHCGPALVHGELGETKGETAGG